jgi:hypothetical protein
MTATARFTDITPVGAAWDGALVPRAPALAFIMTIMAKAALSMGPNKVHLLL